ncbi:hypothetical protein KSS87_019228, partial [Heliosperma pusillum]
KKINTLFSPFPHSLDSRHHITSPFHCRPATVLLTSRSTSLTLSTPVRCPSLFFVSFIHLIPNLI